MGKGGNPMYMGTDKKNPYYFEETQATKTEHVCILDLCKMILHK